MTRHIVAMPLIPGGVRSNFRVRGDLAYAKYAQATWRWWCKRNGIEFVPVERPLGGPGFAHMPPTFQRWHILDRLIADYGEDIRVAIVDADTMIRWDAPNFLDVTRRFSAVAIRHPDWMCARQPRLGDAAQSASGHGSQSAPRPDSVVANKQNPGWISSSLRAFQHLFPGVSLTSSEYFNAGIVVLGIDQRPVIDTLLRFSAAHWPQLDAVIQAGDFGTDQTPLNFMLRRENEPIFFLPGSFNVLHCFPMDAELVAIDCSPSPDAARFASKAFANPLALQFIRYAYVWHFTNVISLRAVAMRETWFRIRQCYPGADAAD